jgi:hypothetical protein
LLLPAAYNHLHIKRLLCCRFTAQSLHWHVRRAVAHAQADSRFHSNHVLHVQQLKSAARHDSIRMLYVHFHPAAFLAIITDGADRDITAGPGRRHLLMLWVRGNVTAECCMLISTLQHFGSHH